MSSLIEMPDTQLMDLARNRSRHIIKHPAEVDNVVDRRPIHSDLQL